MHLPSEPSFHHFKDRCIFQWRRMKKDEFIDLSLERGLGMELGKFLVPEFARELEMDIDDLEKLRPLAEKLDEKHFLEQTFDIVADVSDIKEYQLQDIVFQRNS